MRKMKVVLDPRGGGWEKGIEAEGVLEKEVSLMVCRKLRDVLTSAGVEVILTRDDDLEVSAYNRILTGNDKEVDLFLSWGYDAHADESLTGVSLWLDPAAPNLMRHMIELEQIGEHICGCSGQLMMGVFQERDKVLSLLKTPAMLVKGGFLSNREERARCIDPAFQQKQADGAALGILSFLQQVTH
jgi:N-acetylmuramoyl-L-alanine amidase